MSVQEFVDVISTFMREHESWAAPIAFLVAFGESLCFASIVWPGWAILVGFSGALAASGVAPSVLAPMIIAAGLGGTLGYAFSYWIGLYFKDSIANIWPFKSRPELIPHGERFFERYGAWSVFLGHFVGPVRAVIPVVAGMFKMRQLPFQVANTVSAFIWAGWAVLAPYWSIFYKDAIFAFLSDNAGLVTAALFLTAFLNSIPMPLMAAPTLIVFVALGFVFLLAGGDPMLACLAGAAGAFAGDVVAYLTGKRHETDLHTVWPSSFTPEAASDAQKFVARWGALGLIPSKFHTTLRSFVPLAAGSAQLSLGAVLLVSAVSCLVWSGALLLLPFFGLQWLRS